MSSPLDHPHSVSYFEAIRAQLTRMPEDAREEHVTELQQHFEALLAASQLQDVTEEEAIALALTQIGNPKYIGRNLWKEWKLTQEKPFWKAVAIIGLGQLLFLFLCDGINALWENYWVYSESGPLSTVTVDGWRNGFHLVVSLAPIGTGIIIGRCLPKRIIVATLFVTAIASLHSLWFLYSLYRFNITQPNIVVHCYINFNFLLKYLTIETITAYVARRVKWENWSVRLQ